MRIKWLFIGMGLIVLAIAWHFNLPSMVTTGSPTDTAVFVFLIGCGLLAGTFSLRSAIRTTRKQKDGSIIDEETHKWNLPGFMQTGNEEKLLEETRQIRREKRAEYRARFRKSLNPDEDDDNINNRR